MYMHICVTGTYFLFWLDGGVSSWQGFFSLLSASLVCDSIYAFLVVCYYSLYIMAYEP